MTALLLAAVLAPVTSSIVTLIGGWRRATATLTRRAVFARDGWLCQYCGSAAENVDHVIPRSRGGPHQWDNVVAACRRCNSKKENRTPHEAGLSLRTKPFAPPSKRLPIRPR